MKKNFIFDLIGNVLEEIGNGKNETSVSNQIQKEPLTISNEDIVIDTMLGKQIKFKSFTPSYFWNSNNDLNSSLDTVLIVSKNGEPKYDYDTETLSGIMFGPNSKYFDSEEDVKKLMYNWHNISNLQIIDLANQKFSRKIVGETDEFYLEVYCIKYQDIYYTIELNIYKKNYNVEEIEKIISEYHTIIDTLEILEK